MFELRVVYEARTAERHRARRWGQLRAVSTGTFESAIYLLESATSYVYMYISGVYCLNLKFCMNPEQTRATALAVGRGLGSVPTDVRIGSLSYVYMYISGVYCLNLELYMK